MPDFLVMPYRGLDFLCLRDEFVGSVAKQGENGQVRYGSRSLLELNLDRHLRSFFPFLSIQATGLCLICRSDRLYQPEAVSEDLVAVAVVSESYMRSYPFAEFRLVPFLIRSRLAQRGITAARFSQERIQYLLDLPSLFKDAANLERTAS